jgi:hypothetical protein
MESTWMANVLRSLRCTKSKKDKRGRGFWNANKPLRIRRSELMKRRPERQPWGGKDGEAARAITASRFLS